MGARLTWPTTEKSVEGLSITWDPATDRQEAEAWLLHVYGSLPHHWSEELDDQGAAWVGVLFSGGKQRFGGGGLGRATLEIGRDAYDAAVYKSTVVSRSDADDRFAISGNLMYRSFVGFGPAPGIRSETPQRSRLPLLRRQ